MKLRLHYLTILLFAFFTSFSQGQNPVDLFFSEYAEGSSYNKYFEIYNPTNDTIDLNNYAYPMVNV